MDLGNLLSINFTKFIEKYFFPMNYLPFILIIVIIILSLVIVFRKKIRENISLFTTFFKLGLFTFGGGYAMIPHMKDIVVEEKNWISEDELLEMIGISESTPGPIAINMATFIGYKRGKVLGSILATLGVVLPSLIIIFLISLFFNEFINTKYVSAAFTGIKACVAFLILKAGYGMFAKMKKNIFNIIMFSLIFSLMIILELTSTSFSSIILIIGGGLLFVGINLIKSLKEKEMKQ